MTLSTERDERTALLDEVLAGIDGPLRTGRERLVDELLERGFDVETLRPIAEKIGPTPEDLGQDVTLVTTADDIRRGEWWKDEYQVRWNG